jgi:predicted lipase
MARSHAFSHHMILTPFLSIVLICVQVTLAAKTAPPTTIATNKQLAHIKRYAHLAAAAYLDDKQDWQCNPCQRETFLRTSKAELYVDNNKTAHHSIVLVNHDLKSVLVTFRGTDNVSGWLYNLQISKTGLKPEPPKEYVKAQVHRGFQQVYQFGQNRIMDMVATLLKESPTFTVQITGQSLGGALANLCAAQVAYKFPTNQVVLTTFQAPRVGNQVFANYLNSMPNLKIYRVTHAKEPICHLPPRSLGYYHAGDEYWIDQPEGTTIYQCKPKTEDEHCSWHTTPEKTMKNHILIYGYNFART